MISYLFRLLFKISGWQTRGDFPDAKKIIALAAPHTSNFDYIIGMVFLLSKQIKPSILMKKELFFFPLNVLLKQLGGIPVNRNKKTNIKEQLVKEFHNRSRMMLIITPEGTRKKINNWKKGFYEIAQQAKVPVLITTLDYKTKTIGFEGFLKISGNLVEDFQVLNKHYSKVTARKPKQFNINTEYE
jgi:1-acyl-sn-glycerol-3-phosphate acyltransferase